MIPLRMNEDTRKVFLFILFMCYSQLAVAMKIVTEPVLGGTDDPDFNIWKIVLKALIVLLSLSIFVYLPMFEKGICLGFALLLSTLIYVFPQTPAIMSENGLTQSLQIESGFIGFYIAFLCVDSRRLDFGLKVIAVFFFIYNSWDFLTGRAFTVGDYNMNFGFKAMFTDIIAIYLSFKEDNRRKKICWLIISVILFVYIVMLGSRGPLIGILCILALTYFKLLVTNPNLNANKKILSVIAVILVLFFLFSFGWEIMGIVGNLLRVFGLDVSESRTWGKLLSGTLISDSNREQLWPTFIQEFNWLGHGAYSSWYYHNGYPHNFFIEVIYDFGMIFGGIFVIIFLGMVILTSRILNGKSEFSLFIILLIYCIGRLLTSFTFWWDTYFWMLFGVMVKSILVLKKRYGQSIRILET